MATVSHLLDKSAWAQAQHSGDVAAQLARLIRRGQLALCTMTALEILYSARNPAEYERDHRHLTGLPWRDLAAPRRAVDLQLTLAAHGWHRTPLPDVVIAATAAEHGLTILHYDSDYERIADLAGARHQWIIARGDGHGARLPQS